MLTTRFNLKPESIMLEIDELHKAFLASRRYLAAQLKYLKNASAGQGRPFGLETVAEGATAVDTERQLSEMDAAYKLRKRHLNALLKVLEDEKLEITEANEPALPLNEGAAA